MNTTYPPASSSKPEHASKPGTSTMPGTANRTTTTGDEAPGSSRRHPSIERALLLLGEVFEFEIVDRCPDSCIFCDDRLRQAA